ncbi:MAG: DUF72 domain-containing protein [Hyphomicrobiaceae bacterium]
MTGQIRVGIGGWTFEPWRGAFYPEGLAHKRELEFASRALTSIEINGSYYSTFKRDIWKKWHDETPDDFMFAVKALRYCTNRKSLPDAGSSVERFLAQGLTELGEKLGPINWQLAGTKRFNADEIGAFLAMLPKESDGIRLRHALEVRHPSFATPEFYDLARKHNVAIVHAEGDDFPQIDEQTADFFYARLMSTSEDLADGISVGDRSRIAKQAKSWAKGGDVFIYFIAGAKVRNPAAAQALIGELKP